MTLNGRNAPLAHYFTLYIPRFPEPAAETRMKIDPNSRQ